jgi:hypothetical protein
MTKRVNISYSIKLADLDKEVRRLINNGLRVLEDLHEDSYRIGEADNLLTFDNFKQIDALRERLVDVDTIMADTSRIISSYLNYEATSIAKQTASQNTENAQDNLKEQLAALHSQMKNSSNEAAD